MGLGLQVVTEVMFIVYAVSASKSLRDVYSLLNFSIESSPGTRQCSQRWFVVVLGMWRVSGLLSQECPNTLHAFRAESNN